MPSWLTLPLPAVSCTPQSAPVTASILICTRTLFYLAIRIALSPRRVPRDGRRHRCPPLPAPVVLFYKPMRVFSPIISVYIFCPPGVRGGIMFRVHQLLFLFITLSIDVTIACRNSIQGLLGRQQIKLALMDVPKVGY